MIANDREQVIAKLVMAVSTFAGRASLILFVIFLYVGPLNIVGLNLPEIGVLAWDGIISAAFFAQHSFMIRRSFRNWLSNTIPSHYSDAAFAIFSSIVLTAVVVFWQSSETVVCELQGFMYWIARGVFVLAIAGIGWVVYALKPFDLFGRSSIKAHLSGEPLRPLQFTVSGPYLWVRHPLYFFVLLLIWSYPELTADRLLLNILWTAWIYIGTTLEEKDLLTDFGDKYREYQRKVPMLIPWTRLKQ